MVEAAEEIKRQMTDLLTSLGKLAHFSGMELVLVHCTSLDKHCKLPALLLLLL